MMECMRCGTCCTKGGPTLHQADRPLWDRGLLAPEQLLTLRLGELVRDPLANHGADPKVPNTLRPLRSELLRVRGQGDTWVCLFLSRDENNLAACAIYQDRPLECRELSCQDTSALAAASATARLTRFDLLPAEHPLTELARDHQVGFDLQNLNTLARAYRQGDAASADDLLQTVHREQALRQELTERGLAEASLDFLLGRALWRILPQWGMQLRYKNNEYHIVITGPSPMEEYA